MRITAHQLLLRGGRRIRLTVKSDAYRAQCFARAEVWHPGDLKWNMVYSIPPRMMATEEGLCYFPGKTGEQWGRFEKDLQKLLTRTEQILG